MLTLRCKTQTTVPVEAECITPDNLAGKSPGEIRALKVQHGNQQEPLGEFFDVSGDAADGRVVVEGDCTRVKWIGASMRRGRITVEGNAGMHLGAEMRGGLITVTGNAGDWVGAEMRGGVIHVAGDAGHLIGAAYRGAARGMRGGTILIEGRAGNEVGSTMRRGLIAIGGDVGDYPGVSMIAGSLLLFGRTGVRTGAGMKRGTIALFPPPDAPPALLPTFRPSGTHRPVFLALYLRHLRALGFPLCDDHFDAPLHCYRGDLVSLGKGEILVCPANT